VHVWLYTQIVQQRLIEFFSWNKLSLNLLNTMYKFLTLEMKC
jgi:hypothetical protein